MAYNGSILHSIDSELATQLICQELADDYLAEVQALADLADEVTACRISPIVALNELNMPVEYTNIRQRMSSRLAHGVTIIVANVAFDGWGRTKIEAITSATSKCFNRLLFILENRVVKHLELFRRPSPTIGLSALTAASSSNQPPPYQRAGGSNWPFDQSFRLDLDQGLWKERPKESTMLVPDKYDRTLAEGIAKLVRDKYTEQLKKYPQLSKGKVYAGIVITVNNNIEDARIISVTTGNRYALRKKKADQGRSINNFRAEVLARRCLQRYLYAQLYLYANEADPRVPLADNDLEPVASGYQLKSDRQVHMYISNAQCKDCRCSRTCGRPGLPHIYQNGQCRGSVADGYQTYNDDRYSIIKRSNVEYPNKRLLYLTSCSDKLMKWCVVGLQGALLSRLIQPIYLHSLVLGSPQEHYCGVFRPTCNPADGHISAVPMPFTLHRPLLTYVTESNLWVRRAAAPGYSLCWCCTAAVPEILNCKTGRLRANVPSQLCKQIVFSKWQYLIKTLPLIRQRVVPEFEPKFRVDRGVLIYADAKKLCPAYLVAKNHLIQSLKQAKVNRWVVRHNNKHDRFPSRYSACDPKTLFR